MLTCLLTIVAKEEKKQKQKQKGGGNREKKKRNHHKKGRTDWQGLARGCAPAWMPGQGRPWGLWGHASEPGSRSAGCSLCTNLHVLFSLQRSLGLITSDSRQWSTRTPGYMWQTSMAHEACGQRRRHLTGQCHWWPLNRRWEGVSMWGSYQWRDQVRLRENLSEKTKHTTLNC